MAVDEVRPRYKRTEVGVIPEDWEVCELRELADISSGGTPSREIDRFWNGSIPWVTTAEIDGESILQTAEHITLEGLQNSAARLLSEGTILLALYGQGKTRGKVARLGIEAATNQACAAIKLKGRVTADYLFYSLASAYERIRGLSNGGSQDNLTGEIVKSLVVAFPSTMNQQDAIAEKICELSRLEDSNAAVLAKKRDLKQAAMQELLRPKHNWQAVQLGELGSFLKGRGVSRADSSSGSIPCVRYGEIYTDHRFWIKAFRSHISETVAEQAQSLRKGDLLFAGSGETRGEIGKCVAYLGDHRAYAGGDIVILRPSRGDPLFLSYILASPDLLRQKAALGQGDAVVHIGAAALARLRLHLPPMDEQILTVTTLSDMDAEIAAVEAHLEKYRKIEQGMMQNLLTGAIRLV